MGQTLKKQEEAIVNALQSDNDQTVIETVEKIREKGSAALIPFLIDLLISTKSGEIQQAVERLFSELREQACVAPIMEALQSKSTEGYKHILVSVFWQSALDGSEYFENFVKLAIEEDYLTCIECLSVLENIDFEINEDQLVNAIADINSELHKTTDKTPLLVDLATMLQNKMIG